MRFPSAPGRITVFNSPGHVSQSLDHLGAYQVGGQLSAVHVHGAEIGGADVLHEGGRVVFGMMHAGLFGYDIGTFSAVIRAVQAHDLYAEFTIHTSAEIVGRIFPVVAVNPRVIPPDNKMRTSVIAPYDGLE